MIRKWLRKWLGISLIQSAVAELTARVNYRVDKRLEELEEQIKTLNGRVEDLEAAYPDYKKAKAEADENKAREIIPGFTPFSQRKRNFERSRMRQPEKK